MGRHRAPDVRITCDLVAKSALHRLIRGDVLGEATWRLSDEFRTAHPAEPWSDPVRLRNRIVHGYWSIEVDVRLRFTYADKVGSSGRYVRRTEARGTLTFGRSGPTQGVRPHRGEVEPQRRSRGSAGGSSGESARDVDVGHRE